MAKQYAARRSFGYAGKELDRGQLVELVAAKNDEKLLRLGYFMEFKKGGLTAECGTCFGKFIDSSTRDQHVKFRHPRRERSDLEELEFQERDDEHIQEIAPLNMDKTKASMGA